jgi:hypothetical protein
VPPEGIHDMGKICGIAYIVHSIMKVLFFEKGQVGLTNHFESLTDLPEVQQRSEGRFY